MTSALSYTDSALTVVGLLLGMSNIIFKGKVAFDSMMATVFPMLYPGLFFSLILPLQDLASADSYSKDGKYLDAYGLWLVCIS